MNKDDKYDRDFRILFNRFYGALFTFALGYLDDKEAVADIIQECFIKFWEYRYKLRDNSNIQSFLYKMVRNKCLNVIRDYKTNMKVDVEVLESISFFRDNLIENESLSMFYKAVSQLPIREQNVIYLSLDGLRNSEIAVKLNIAESSVHTHKKLAYKKLKIILKDNYYLFLFFS